MTHDHPVFLRLTDSQAAFARHVVLHELEQRLHATACTEALSRKVHHLVNRGVPYFAPGDAHYREWAEQVTACWTSLESLPPRVTATRAVSGA